MLPSLVTVFIINSLFSFTLFINSSISSNLDISTLASLTMSSLSSKLPILGIKLVNPKYLNTSKISFVL